jgi:hypothetical protein
MTDGTEKHEAGISGATMIRATEHPRSAEKTADAARGTAGERSGERAERERRFTRATPMPADRHE